MAAVDLQKVILLLCHNISLSETRLCSRCDVTESTHNGDSVYFAERSQTHVLTVLLYAVACKTDTRDY